MSNNMGWFNDTTKANIVWFVSIEGVSKKYKIIYDCKDTGEQYDHLEDTRKNKKDGE
jgi:hypothetical protein